MELDCDHRHLFPRSLGEIVGRYNVQELHISLTGGLWRHEFWGYPMVDAPPGAESWVWFKHGTSNGKESLTVRLKDAGIANPSDYITINGLRTHSLLNGDLGHLVMLPLNFLCNESLTPNASSVTGMMPTSLWT